MQIQVLGEHKYNTMRRKEREIEYTELLIGSDCDQSETFEKVYIPPKSSSHFGWHVWDLCAIHQIATPFGPGWTGGPPSNGTGSYPFNPGPATPTVNMPGTVVNIPSGTLIGPFYGTFLPSPNPYWYSSGAANPNYPVQNFFYDWAVTQVGPITIGDKIEIDVSMKQHPHFAGPTGSGITHPYSAMCTSTLTNGSYLGATNKFCLTYMGICYTPNSSCFNTSRSFNNTAFSITLNGCDCKNFGLGGDSQIEGWDCVSNNNIYEANLMGTPDKCVPVFYGSGLTPQFATKQDCINSGCGQITTGPTPVITTP